MITGVMAAFESLSNDESEKHTQGGNFGLISLNFLSLIFMRLVLLHRFYALDFYENIKPINYQ